MTATVSLPPTSRPPTGRASRRRVILAAAALLAAAGAGVGIGLAVSATSSRPSSSPSAASDFAYYQQMMRRYGLPTGGMMDGNYGWMMADPATPG